MTQWTEIAQTVADLVNAAAPIIGALAPEAAPALSIAEKILHGVIAAEPVAISLYSRITSGDVPSSAELQQFAVAYETSYQRLKADIARKLAATASNG